MAAIPKAKKLAPRNRAPKRPRRPATPEWKLRRAGGLQVLESPSLAKLPWLVHGFSTRPGGASNLETLCKGKKKTEAILNLGFTDWDKRERVAANREKFFRAIGAPKMRVVALRQIHSDIIHTANSKEASFTKIALPDNVPQGDALITRERGVLLVVQTADCIPILLADTKRRAVAAIHSGWRGTLARIAAKTLGRMQMEFGTRPEDVVAALGPGIGRCCYEVGEEVAREFAAQFPEAREWFDGPFDSLAAGESDPNWLPWLTMKPPGHAPPPLRVQLDLIAANRAILAASGVAPGNISSSGYCTACRTNLFFSYRHERTTGRMMAAIGIS
jgi:YfiH family protein